MECPATKVHCQDEMISSLAPGLKGILCHVMHVWPWILWTGFCAVVLLRVLLMAHCLNMGASFRQLPTLVDSYEFFVQSNLRPRNLILATKMLSVVVVCCAQPIMCLKM